MPKPTTMITVSSESPVAMNGRTRREPQRASENSPIRNENAIAIDSAISPAPSVPLRIGCSSAR